jgi:hypothetical protein
LSSGDGRALSAAEGAPPRLSIETDRSELREAFESEEVRDSFRSDIESSTPFIGVLNLTRIAGRDTCVADTP